MTHKTSGWLSAFKDSLRSIGGYRWEETTSNLTNVWEVPSTSGIWRCTRLIDSRSRCQEYVQYIHLESSDIIICTMSRIVQIEYDKYIYIYTCQLFLTEFLSEWVKKCILFGGPLLPEPQGEDGKLRGVVPLGILQVVDERMMNR